MPGGEDHEDGDHDSVGDHDHENYEVDHMKLQMMEMGMLYIQE